MAKLKNALIVTFAVSVLVVSTYLLLSSRYLTLDDANNSVFGRNVYEQNTAVGKRADRNYQISFPKDHASHNEFDIEWWYLTANLQDDSGKVYGLQWTLFRFRNPNSEAAQINEWQNKQIYMAHASIHSSSTHWFSEKFARGGVGNADVTSTPLSLFIDDWQWTNSNSARGLFPATLEFTALNQSEVNAPPISASFTIKQHGPFVLHGKDGYSVKSTSEHASHYYSAPFIDIEGTIKISNNVSTVQSVNLTGKAWFDHEWTSQLLDKSTEGWDWLSLHLEDGSKIMAFRMRLKGQSDYITGSYISSTGEQITLKSPALLLQNISTTEVNNRPLPLNWSLSIPSKNIDLTISTIKNDQWNNALIPYYEGMVSIKGSHTGNGFLELTGY